jgi:hypothetical protein
MGSEQVLEVLTRRHVFDSARPFSSIRNGLSLQRGRPTKEKLPCP